MSDASTSKRGLPEQVKMRHSTHFVEDLAVRSEVPVGRMIDLEKIEPDPSQPLYILTVWGVGYRFYEPRPERTQ